MKELRSLLITSLMAVFVCTLFGGCDEETIEIPSYWFAKVIKCERDAVVTQMSYGDQGLSEFKLFENNELVSTSFVRYTPSRILCDMKGIHYDIQLSNAKGISRTESVTAKETIDGHEVTIYSVNYRYDAENRLDLVRVDGSELVDPNDPYPVYVSYKYEENRIVIYEEGVHYYLELSSADNVGYVCNVLDFAGSPHTSKYVINPDLYYINIYGAPILKLPQGVDVKYTGNNQLLQVGKYSYAY